MSMFQVDEALINANAALANTNNPDDQVKIKNLYDSFKKGKISKSEFDKGIYYYIQPSPKYDDKVNEQIANAITEGSKVFGDPEKLALRAAAARQGLRADRQHRLNENYYTDAYGSKLFHDAMDGNIVTPDSIRAAEYVRQLRAANAAKAQAQAQAEAKAPAPRQEPAPAEPVLNQQPAVGKADSTAKANVAKQEHPEIVGKLANIARNITDVVMQAAKAQGKTDAAKQGETPTTDGAHTEKVATNPGNGIDVQGKSEIPNSSAVSDANAAKDQQPQKTDADAKAAAGKNIKPGKNPSMSDDKIDALWDVLSGNTAGGTQGAKTDNGTYASAGVAKGGTKTVGYDPYDPNPGNVSLAYAMRNAPEQERRAALIDEWNKEHGISYVTGKDGLIYRIDPQHPNGYVDPFKNDLSKIGSTYASPGISKGGTYATGEGIKDANGNVLTNPGGDWEYQYALRDPQYGLGMMGKMSDAQKKYLQAVADGMGFNYNFTGAPRYV